MNRSRPGGNSKPNSVRASFLSPVQERFETDEVCVASSCSGPALFQTILERRSTKLWKKCRLRAENAATRQFQVQPTLPKSPHYWEILSLLIDGEMQAAVSLAEGEELGSNLLHVGQRTPANSAGRVPGKSATKRVLRPHFGVLSSAWRPPRTTPASLRRQASARSA